MAKSIHSLDGDIIKIRRGLAIYKTHASPYWFARILDPNTKKYRVRSTKEKARLPARKVAEELDTDLKGQKRLVPREFSFKYYATRFIDKGRRLAATGDRNPNYIRTAQLFLDNDEWGLMKTFATQDIRELRTRHFSEFMDALAKKRPDL